MAYTTINFKTKKALKEAVATFHATDLKADKAITCFQPGFGPSLTNFTGRVALEGPHYPAAHTWYAEAELVNGKVMKVS